MEFIVINNEITKKTEADLTPMFWGGPFHFSQKMWFGFGGIPLFAENLKSMIVQLQLLGAEIPELFQKPRELFRITKRMLNKNRFYRSGIIDFHFFVGRQHTQSVISSVAFQGFDFPFLENGLLLGVPDIAEKATNPLNRFKFANMAIWAATWPKLPHLGFNNAIFLNSTEAICDCISANIFMVKNGALTTPALGTGCYEDTLRPAVLELAERMGLAVLESEEITAARLIEMDEIFLAGEEHGIQWVLGIGNKRFIRNQSIVLHQKLNGYLKSKVG